MFSLSQGHLNLLTTCPRKFQHLVLDQLSVPPSPDLQAALDWGNRFHLLMQQRELGLAIAPLAQEDGELADCLQAFEQTAPDLFLPAADPRRGMELLRESEHSRSLPFDNYLLTVVYDLLILYPDRGEIFDWKTYLKPRDRATLATDWQTKLYLFVLAETQQTLTPILAPEAISFTYWFVRASDPAAPSSTQPAKPQPKPQAIRFTYNRDLHEQTRQELTALCQQLTVWLTDPLPNLPQVPPASPLCAKCPFAVRCQRVATAAVDPMSEFWGDRLPDITEIPEITL